MHRDILTFSVCRKVFRQPGSEAGKIGCARGIAVDQAGDIYVAEQDTRRVQVFDQEGNLLRTYGGEGVVSASYHTQAQQINQ